MSSTITGPLPLSSRLSSNTDEDWVTLAVFVPYLYYLPDGSWHHRPPPEREIVPFRGPHRAQRGGPRDHLQDGGCPGSRTPPQEAGGAPPAQEGRPRRGEVY